MRRDDVRSRPDVSNVLGLEPVVWRLFGDDHVVSVALLQTGLRDPGETRVFLHLGDAGAAGKAHARAKSANELGDHGGEAALVGRATLTT